MTGDQFTAWMRMMKFKKGEAAEALGLNRRTIPTYMRDGAPRHVGLACAALSMGLSEWGDHPAPDRQGQGQAAPQH